MKEINNEKDYFGYEKLKNQVNGLYKYAPSTEEVVMRNLNIEAMNQGLALLSDEDRDLIYKLLVDMVSINTYALHSGQEASTVRKRIKNITAVLRNYIEHPELIEANGGMRYDR